MKTISKIGIVVAILCVALGFLLSFWQLSLLGILCMILVRQWVLAILIGIFLDVLFGVPTGQLRVLSFPFTILAVAGIGIQIFINRYVRKSFVATL